MATAEPVASACADVPPKRTSASVHVGNGHSEDPIAKQGSELRGHLHDVAY